MRFATLTPLLLLGASIAAVELLSLRSLSLDRDQIKLSLRDAEVLGTSPESTLRLDAREMQISAENGIMAKDVSGEAVSAQSSHFFKADRISRPPGENQQIVLEGNVEISAGGNQLRTKRVFVSGDDVITGGEISIEGAQGTANASSFTLIAENELVLSGGVTATINTGSKRE